MREIKFRAWSTSTQEMRFLSPYDKQAKTNTIFDLKEHETWKVMQYTGLKDKNGVEIYEGDIVSTFYRNGDLEKTGVVEYSIDGFCWCDHYYISTALSYTGTCEVIGNIYENPELLEGE